MNRRDLAKAMALTGSGLVLGSAAASAQSAPSSGGKLASILEQGRIRVGTTGDFNPMSFRDPKSNEYQGFDIEAMKQLAADMAVEIEWVQTEWATIVAGIAADRFDIFSGASVNMGRARTAAFTRPYFEAGTVPLALKEQAGKYTSWESMNSPGARIAVSMGTVFEDQAKQHFPQAEIRAVQSPATGFQEVLARRADVTITSNVEASTLVKRFEELVVLVPGSDMRNKRPFAYVVAQGDPTWLNFVNTWVTLKRIEGLFDQLESVWLPT